MSGWNLLKNSKNDAISCSSVSNVPVVDLTDSTDEEDDRAAVKQEVVLNETEVPGVKTVRYKHSFSRSRPSKKTRNNSLWFRKYIAARKVVVNLAYELEKVTQERNNLLHSELLSGLRKRRSWKKRNPYFNCKSCFKQFKKFKTRNHKIKCKALKKFDSDFEDETIPRQCCLCKDFKTQRSPNARVHLSRFPSSPNLRRKWIEALKETTFYSAFMHNPMNEQFDPFLCSIHFEDDCFQRGRLTKSAIPSKFLSEHGAGPPSSEDVNEDEGAFLVNESCVTLANIGITPQVEGGELNQSGDIFSKEIDIPIDLSIPIKERLIDSAHNYHRPSVIRNPSPGIIYPHSTSSVVINLRSEYVNTTSAPTKTQNSGPLEASELLYLRKCPLCKKAFYYMNNYSRHMENHGALQWKL